MLDYNTSELRSHMAAEVNPSEEEQPRSGSPRSGAGRLLLLWCAAVGLVVAALASAGWYGWQRWSAAKTAENDARAAGELHHKLAVTNQPLTDDEFAAALALCDAADPETRFTALLAATADTVRYHPERKAQVVPVAARLMADRERVVREKALRCLGSLRAREHIELIRPSLQAADPRERKAAEEALAKLEAPDAPK